MSKVLILVGVINLALSGIGLNDALRGPPRTLQSKLVVDYDTWKDESIVESLCKQFSGQTREISRISTINWLHEYIQNTWDEIPQQAPFLSFCFNQYREPLEHLQAIVTIGHLDGNTCDHVKIDLIEEFHRKYILGSLFPAGAQQPSAIPEALRLFFMRYTVEVTEACKWALMRNLPLASEYLDVDSVLDGHGFGKVIDLLRNYFGAPAIIRDFDDFVHIWDMVDDYGHRSGELPPELTRDPATGERPGFMIKMRSAGGLLALQAECRNNLRPIYGPMVLPVMRLAGLGYHLKGRGSSSSSASAQMAFNTRAQDWYNIAQACEALLPLGMFEDPYLEPGKAEMITIEEAAQLAGGRTQMALRNGPQIGGFRFDASIMSGIDSLESVFRHDSRDLVGEIQFNIGMRRHYFKRLMKQLKSQLKDKLKSKLKDFSLSSRAQRAQKWQANNPMLSGGGGGGGGLDDYGDYLEDDLDVDGGDTYEEYASNNHQLIRRKRALFSSSRSQRRNKDVGLEYPGQKRTMRQKFKRIAIISILVAVISALVFLVVWMIRG